MALRYTCFSAVRSRLFVTSHETRPFGWRLPNHYPFQPRRLQSLRTEQVRYIQHSTSTARKSSHPRWTTTRVALLVIATGALTYAYTTQGEKWSFWGRGGATFGIPTYGNKEELERVCLSAPMCMALA